METSLEISKRGEFEGGKRLVGQVVVSLLPPKHHTKGSLFRVHKANLLSCFLVSPCSLSSSSWAKIRGLW